MTVLLLFLRPAVHCSWARNNQHAGLGRGGFDQLGRLAPEDFGSSRLVSGLLTLAGRIRSSRSHQAMRDSEERGLESGTQALGGR